MRVVRPVKLVMARGVYFASSLVRTYFWLRTERIFPFRLLHGKYHQNQHRDYTVCHVPVLSWYYYVYSVVHTLPRSETCGPGMLCRRYIKQMPTHKHLREDRTIQILPCIGHVIEINYQDVVSGTYERMNTKPGTWECSICPKGSTW